MTFSGGNDKFMVHGTKWIDDTINIRIVSSYPIFIEQGREDEWIEALIDAKGIAKTIRKRLENEKAD